MCFLINDADSAFAALESEQPCHAAAFDAVAEEYDAHFTSSRLGGWLRDAVRRHLTGLVQPGDRLLELGCGTGEDALWLARLGANVIATDVSSAMLEAAARKAAMSEVSSRITFVQLDLAEISHEAETTGVGNYDAVLANFGVLNCLPDRRPLAVVLARWVRPGGRVALVVMPPVCPWEMAWYTAHGQLGRAFRRFQAGGEAHLGDGATVRVWYPSPRRLRAEFAPAFRLVYTAGIGVLLPPSYLAHLVDRWPRVFAQLATWEADLPGGWLWSWLADHYLMVFERR
jgi:ubiquinone/menaquinone biosynthesis C-methylase UbiE